MKVTKRCVWSPVSPTAGELCDPEQLQTGWLLQRFKTYVGQMGEDLQTNTIKMQFNLHKVLYVASIYQQCCSQMTDYEAHRSSSTDILSFSFPVAL